MRLSKETSIFDKEALSNGIRAAGETARNYIRADESGIRIANAAPDEATTYQHQTATSTEFVVDGMVAASFGSDGAQMGFSGSTHIKVAPDGSRMSFMNGNNEVAYVAIDEKGDAVFYMTRSMVVKDMQFGEGDWKWYKRDGGNMSLKWMGVM